MRLSRSIAAPLVGALLLAACGAPAPPGDAARIDAGLVAHLDPDDARAVGEAVNAFGFDLLGEVTDGHENAVTSPLSVAVLLAMVLAGAGGDTAGTMAAALHLDDARDARVGALLRAIADTDDVTLSVSNALWANEGTPLEQDYLEFVERTFGATLEEADLGVTETAEDIDRWVDEHTGLLEALDATEWHAGVAALAAVELEEIALPRFELEWEAVLNDPLGALGMGIAFSPESDFRPMSPADPWLDVVVHKTHIRVDEEGTEAAAVTGGVMVESAPVDPLVFRVDRPFSFTVSDTETGAILFLGAVADPRG